MNRAWVVLLAASFSSVALSGCFGEAEPAEALRVPVWSAGHSWTYEITTSHSMLDGARRSGEKTTERFTTTVFNTTEPFDGEPAYYVRTTRGLDHPIWSGSVMAYRASDLALVGVGHEWSHGPEPHPVAYSGDEAVVLSPVGPRNWGSDPCQGRGLIRPAEGEYAFPQVTFPLQPGDTIRGRWTPDDEGWALDYVLRVQSPQMETVPAGTFRVVPVTVDLAFAAGTERPPYFDGVRIRAEYAYAPEVENLVRATVTASFSSPYGQMEYRSDARLADFSLQTKPEQPAPARQEDFEYDYQPVRIVTDTAFPINGAEGPVTASFGLEEGSDARAWRDNGLRVVEQVPAKAPLDLSRHEVRWLVHDDHWDVVAEATGPTLTAEFGAGRYHVRADVVPTVCGATHLASAYGTIANYWEKQWTVRVDAGIARTVPVDVFPVTGYPSQASGEWTLKSNIPAVSDNASPRFVSPSGQAHRAPKAPNSGWVPVHEPGEWRLEWEVAGAHVGNSSPPVAVGHQATIKLRIDYSYDVHPPMH